MTEAKIENGEIVIRLALDTLPAVLESGWVCNVLPTRYKITNVAEFAADLVRELNREEENGSTRIYTMFDKAIFEAVDQGAFGIEEHEQQEP
jgi:hypothetical protein